MQVNPNRKTPENLWRVKNKSSFKKATGGDSLKSPKMSNAVKKSKKRLLIN